MNVHAINRICSLNQETFFVVGELSSGGEIEVYIAEMPKGGPPNLRLTWTRAVYEPGAV